jgi:hypothetical protein
MLLTREQLELLKKENVLFAGLLPGIKDQENGTILVDLSHAGVKEAFRKLFQDWISFHDIVEADPTAITLTAEEIQAEKDRQRAAAAAVEADLNAAAARVRFWSQKWGLLDDQHNQGLILKGLKERFQNRLSASAVDTIISELKDQLHFKSAASESAPTPLPPTPPQPRLVSDGRPELPLDASDFVLRQASRAQLADLARRQNAKPPVAGFKPCPPELTRKLLLTCTRAQFETYRMRHGDENLNARLQSRA